MTPATLFGLGLSPVTRLGAPGTDADPTQATPQATIWVLPVGCTRAALDGALPSGVPDWIVTSLFDGPQEVVFWSGPNGPLGAVRVKETGISRQRTVDLVPSAFAKLRDLAGQAVSEAEKLGARSLMVRLVATDKEEVRAAALGVELGAYRFNRVGRTKPQWIGSPALSVAKGSTADALAGLRLGVATNLARHLINMSPMDLTPKTFAEGLAEAFQGLPGLTVRVMVKSDLKEQRMGLLRAVGRGAEDGPRVVHIAYRPGQAAPLDATGAVPVHVQKNGKRPKAFVGKGVTFDSGGLDIKPADGMRLMKKDMGGAASLAGLALWLSSEQHKAPADIYLALAENAVSERSFHPGDVLTARTGDRIEITNTDAEGRLVLADVMDFALRPSLTEPEADAKPEVLIDMATLTGAIKVALGAKISGLFATDNALAESLLDAAWQMGEPAWRMPLFGPYADELKSSAGDYSNAALGRYGGAITAALFLRKFAKDIPWAHFDIYSWADSATGPFREDGGTGQGVLTLAAYLNTATEAATG